MTPAKRLFDLVIATVMVVILGLPFLLLLGVLLAVQGRPLFYVAERMKGIGQPFNLWKLRTMTVTGQDSGVSGGDKASRVTPAGSMMRRTRLDEFPQLWNILRGDISFVGPRPPLRQYVERFPAIYAQVLQSRPGITGLATLRFHEHEERLLRQCSTAAETDSVYCRRCIPQKARLDLIYQRHASLCFDLVLIGETISGVFLRRLARIIGGKPD